jgi:large subunit ribosomal protein L21
MRAIIETGGTQVPVEIDSRSRVPRMSVDEGQEVEFDKVLLVSKRGKPSVGRPYIEGASVTAKVMGHGRFDKVTVFKFKRRRKYRRKTGHRQGYTEILVKKINTP